MDMIEWFVGVDWGSEAHQVCIIDGEGSVRGERSFTHTGSGLAEMAAWLLAQAGAAADVIGVAIEVPHGPVVEALMEHGFVVHSLNPKQLDRFRDRFSPAGAKDDRRDARVLADALRTDRRFFRRLDPVDPEVVELREWTRIADDLTVERTRLVNRVRQQLWRYYPQVLTVEGDLAKAWLLELWQLAPTPAKARRVRKDTIARLLKRHRVRCIDAGEVLRRLREPAIPVAPGTTEAAVAHIRSVAERLALVRRQLAQAHQQMDRMTKALAASMENQGGQAGDKWAARRGDPGLPSRSRPDRPRHAARRSLRSSAAQGLPRLALPVRHRPVTRRSGKSMIVVRRLAAHNRLRNASITGRASPCNATQPAVPNTPPSAPVATAMPVPCDPSPTGSSPSPVPCSKTRPPSIPNTRDNAMPRSRYPRHRAAGTIAAKLHLQMVGSPPQ